MISTVNPQYRGLTAKFEGCISTSHYPFTSNVSENDHTSLSRGNNIRLCFYILLQ